MGVGEMVRLDERGSGRASEGLVEDVHEGMLLLRMERVM